MNTIAMLIFLAALNTPTTTVTCKESDAPRIECTCTATKHKPKWYVYGVSSQQLHDHERGNTVFLTVPQDGNTVRVIVTSQGSDLARFLVRKKDGKYEYVILENGERNE